MLPVGKYARIEDELETGVYGADEEVEENLIEECDEPDIYMEDFMNEKSVFKISSKDYKYNAVEGLNRNYSNIEDEEIINFVFYKVDDTGKSPFLLFGLEYLEGTSNTYQFIRCKKGEIGYFETLNSLMGYLRDEEQNVYLFYQLDNTQQVTTLLKIMYTNIHFLLADEVMNSRDVFKCKIERNVCSFFRNRPELSFLYNQYNDSYEIPSVGYIGGNMKCYDFISRFGVSPAEPSAPFGVGYYFTNYKNALEQSKKGDKEYLNPIFLADTNGLFNKSIICRFAMFLGETKVLLNKPEDNIDESLLKKHQLEYADTRQYAKMTMRITDHDSIWKMTHSSIYVGNIELDDGTIYEEGPLWCLRDHAQQHFLAFQNSD